MIPSEERARGSAGILGDAGMQPQGDIAESDTAPQPPAADADDCFDRNARAAADHSSAERLRDTTLTP